VKPEKIRLSQAQERRTARVFGGKVQPQSGAGPWAKNDVKTPRYLIEDKRTSATQSIRIKMSDYDALAHNAALIGREPVMHIQIGRRDFILVEEWVWESRDE